MNLIKREKISEFLSKLLIYLLIIYTFVMLGRAIWANYKLMGRTSEIENEIEEIKKQNNDLSNLILYYKSPSFMEVEARKKLGLKKPGETVVNIEVKSVSDFQSEVQTQQKNIESPVVTTPTSNPELWWQYFFK